jgi:DNA polymerase (family 10)
MNLISVLRVGALMKNSEIARILRNIAVLLDMDEVPFKPRAYEKAALSIESLEEDVEKIYKEGGIKALKQIPGVGESIAEKIEELIKTGRAAYNEELHKKVPVDLESLAGIEGLGPRTIKTLYQELDIRNIDDLEKAALEHRISKLPHLRRRLKRTF